MDEPTWRCRQNPFIGALIKARAGERILKVTKMRPKIVEYTRLGDEERRLITPVQK